MTEFDEKKYLVGLLVKDPKINGDGGGDVAAPIFSEIIESRSDIMFTDLIEVQLQTSIHPDLCEVMKVPLTYQEKAILLPQDLHLMETVRIWLDQRLGDGTVRRLFDRHTDGGDPIE